MFLKIFCIPPYFDSTPQESVMWNQVISTENVWIKSKIPLREPWQVELAFWA